MSNPGGNVNVTSEHSIGRKPRSSGLLFEEVEYLPPIIDQVVVYHDETKRAEGENDWGHGLLFVPERTKDSLLSDIYKVRCATGYYGKVHFSEISPSVNARKRECTRMFIELGVRYLERQKGCKFAAIFCTKSAIDLRNYGSDSREKDIKFMEVLMRMVLKGGLHYLYNEDWRIELQGIVTDGKPWYREYSEERIFGKLKEGARDYVSFSDKLYIKAQPSNHKDQSCESADDANLLQLTDVLLGSVIQCYARDLFKGDVKEVLVRPMREMLKKRERGKRFKNSTHYRSFTVTRASIVNGKWQFCELCLNPSKLADNRTLPLF